MLGDRRLALAVKFDQPCIKPQLRRAEPNQFLEEICTAAQTKAETLEKQLEEYIRGDPIKAILIAAGVGLLVGLLVRR